MTPLWWNIGCNVIHNRSGTPWTVINRSSQRDLVIPSGPARFEASFAGEIFPGVKADNEIRNQAFEFFKGDGVPGAGTSIFFMFQDCTIGCERGVRFTPSGNPRVVGATDAGAGVDPSYVDIIITPADTPRAVKVY